MGPENTPDPLQAVPPAEMPHDETIPTQDTITNPEVASPIQPEETLPAQPEEIVTDQVAAPEQVSDMTETSDESDPVPPTVINNIEKAEVMAETHNNVLDAAASKRELRPSDTIMADWKARQAGEDYEVQRLAERAGMTPEEVRKLMGQNTSIMVDMGIELIKNQEKFGEPLRAAQKALVLVHDFLSAHGNLEEDMAAMRVDGKLEDDAGNRYWIDSVRVNDGKIPFTVNHADGTIETWNVSPFQFGGELNQYRISEMTTDDNGFNVETNKSRVMTDEDVDKLSSTLEQFKTHQPELSIAA